MNEKTSTSQSLFQVYYLGQTAVDRRCSTAVIPWVIEELKLKAEGMQRVWFTSGQLPFSPAPTKRLDRRWGALCGVTVYGV